MGKFEFNGKSTEDFGLVIQTPPTYEHPERDISKAHIPGRNGDIVLDNKCYKNVQRTYSIGLWYRESLGYYTSFQDILDWLNSANGKYARLEDTYDSEVYRLASFQMNGKFADYFGVGGAATITFDCKPQRFLKSGDIDIVYNDYTAEIANDSTYTAKPYVTISGIDTDNDSVMMLTVLNNGKATSSITIYNFEGSLIFDSEEEVVMDSSLNDQNDKVNLNSKPFPQLEPGNNTLTLGMYNVKTTRVKAYSSIIFAEQTICKAEYKTYAALEQTAQEKVFMRSYKNLIQIKRELYNASSAQSFMSSIAEVYSFGSFNSLMSEYGRQFIFAGTAAENASTTPDWLHLEDQTDGTITATVPYGSGGSVKYGFYIVDKVTKKLYFKKSGDVIATGLSPSSVNTIACYPAVANPTGAINPPSYDGTTYGIDISYAGVPSWIAFVIEYDNDGCPAKLHYMGTTNGYYWTDKTGLFGKATWSYYTGVQNSFDLTVLQWSTSSKTFIQTVGLSFGAVGQLTYRYLNATPTTFPEYEPETSKEVNERGIEEIKMIHDVHFVIEDNDSSNGHALNTIKVKPKVAGYFSYKIGDDDPSAWARRDPDNSSLDIIISSLPSTKTFTIYYLADLPDYSEEEDWPEWLDPTPLTTTSDPNAIILNANIIYFQVLATSKYRVSASSADDTPAGAASWTLLSAGATLETVMSGKTTEDSMYIYKLDVIPEPMDYNRSYTVDDSPATKNPPLWLSVELEPSDVATNETPDKVIFKAGQAGYFKWDSNTTWVYHAVGEDLLEISGMSDCVLYYMASMPQYIDDYFIDDQTLFDLFDINIIESPTPHGDPKKIEFVVAVEGYYRANNSSSWVYLLEGETLVTAQINDSVRLYYLEPDENADLSNLKITIKPRWWKL